MRTQQGLRATKPERQRRIARLIAERAVTSQQELVELLAATGQPATLRVMSPQAPTVVRPTEFILRMTSGMVSIVSQWNWTFWRVVRSAMPRP